MLSAENATTQYEQSELQNSFAAADVFKSLS
jgi:hypothetical protein